jgi:hypothetical protein
VEEEAACPTRAARTLHTYEEAARALETAHERNRLDDPLADDDD